MKKNNAQSRRQRLSAVGAQGGQIRGQGDYWTDIKNVAGQAAKTIASRTPKGTFASLGSTIGGMGGAPVLGRQLGSYFSKLVGFGDYEVKQNSITKMDMGTSVPHFGNISQGIVVTHREYFGDLVAPGTATFTNYTYPLNPGLPGSFPFLAPIANNFDQYQLLGAVVEFKSTASEYSTGTALGSVIIATEYDTGDLPYASKVAMENSQYCTSSKPSESFYHPIECDPSVNVMPRLFTRSAGVPSGKDSRMYDHGMLNVAVVGNNASVGTVLGELWITYQVALFKPQIGPTVFFDHIILPSGLTTAHYFGTDATVGPTTRSTFGGTLDVSNGTGYYMFPPNVFSGNYMLTYWAIGSTTSLTTGPLATGSGIQVLTLANSNTTNVLANASISAAQAVWTIFITVTGRDAKVGFSQGTLPSSVTAADFYIIRLPDSVN